MVFLFCEGLQISVGGSVSPADARRRGAELGYGWDSVDDPLAMRSAVTPVPMRSMATGRGITIIFSRFTESGVCGSCSLSTPTVDLRLKSLTVRVEAHARGEVFTLEQIDGDGRNTTASTILYLDGTSRDFADHGCSGTQSSRRVDIQTIEILRTCASGGWTRYVRRLSAQGKELILDITEQHTDGRRSERRLVLEKREEKER